MTRPRLTLVPTPEPSPLAPPERPVRLPERRDVVEHPGGHVWRRYPEHEARVLKAISARDGR